MKNLPEVTNTSEEGAVMWTEKYRPKTLDEVVNQSEVVQSVGSLARSSGTMPHLLFVGPPGTGKTTVALCLARQLLGSNWREFTLELNASDERGIDMVRQRVKSFSRHATGLLGNIPYGLAILDECDQMTAEAQTALRRIMETNSRTCRFILIANYSGKIIEPIQSRCAVFRFSTLKKEDIANYLRKIAASEKVRLVESGIDAIIQYSEGDLRKVMNMLQAAAALGKTVDEKVVLTVVGRASPGEVQAMLNKALIGRYWDARETLYKLMTTYGLSGRDIIRQIHREIFNLDLPEQTQAELANIVGDYDFRLVEGASEDIQLTALLAQFGRFNKGRAE